MKVAQFQKDVERKEPIYAEGPQPKTLGPNRKQRRSKEYIKLLKEKGLT